MLAATITVGSVLVGLALYDVSKRAWTKWLRQTRRRAWTVIIPD